MTTQLPTYRAPRRGRPQKYPWAVLLNGEGKLVTASDFRRWGSSMKTFRAAALGEASRRKIRMRTVRVNDGIALTFEAPSLFAQSRVEWDQYFDGAQRTWSFDRVPFGLKSTEWLDRLKLEATKAGFEPQARLNTETGDCAFSVVREQPIAASTDQYVATQLPASGEAADEWEADPFEEDEEQEERIRETIEAAKDDRLQNADGIPTRVVIGAPAAGGR